MSISSSKITNINIFFDGWWTLFIIIPCFVNLFDDDDKTGSIVGLLIGVILLLSCQGLINFDLIWKLLLPAILIIIGVSIMYKNIFTKKIEEKIKEKSKSKIDDTNCCATFSSQKIKIEKEKTLNIEVILEDPTSSYKITGNNDLKDGSIIKINTTSKDGSTREYQIVIEKENKIFLYIIGTILILSIVGLIVYVVISKIKENKEELFNLRFQQATGNLEKPGRLKDLRKEVARMKTIIRERELNK